MKLNMNEYKHTDKSNWALAEEPGLEESAVDRSPHPRFVGIELLNKRLQEYETVDAAVVVVVVVLLVVVVGVVVDGVVVV